MSSAPKMIRSRSQLASSYAPGALFTFEGGLGACIAEPAIDSEHCEAKLAEHTKNQILTRIDHIAQAWFARAYACRDGAMDANKVVLGDLCVDDELLSPHTRDSTQHLRIPRV